MCRHGNVRPFGGHHDVTYEAQPVQVQNEQEGYPVFTSLDAGKGAGGAGPWVPKRGWPARRKRVGTVLMTVAEPRASGSNSVCRCCGHPVAELSLLAPPSLQLAVDGYLIVKVFGFDVSSMVPPP